MREISFAIPVYTEVCVLKAALTSNSADLLGRLKSSRHHTSHRNRFISFPFLICFVLTCRVYLDLVGSLELMAELVSWWDFCLGHYFWTTFYIQMCDAFCYLCLILFIYFGRDLLVTVVLVVLLVLRVLMVMLAVLVSLVLWVQE